MQQTGIAIGIKAVACLHRVRIGLLHLRQAAKSADQHEQSGARQMEIGHQQINRFELIARRNENIGFIAKGLDLTIHAGSTFQQAQGGRANGDDPPSGSARFVEGVRRFPR